MQVTERLPRSAVVTDHFHLDNNSCHVASLITPTARVPVYQPTTPIYSPIPAPSVPSEGTGKAKALKKATGGPPIPPKPLRGMQGAGELNLTSVLNGTTTQVPLLHLVQMSIGALFAPILLPLPMAVPLSYILRIMDAASEAVEQVTAPNPKRRKVAKHEAARCQPYPRLKQAPRTLPESFSTRQLT